MDYYLMSLYDTLEFISLVKKNYDRDSEFFKKAIDLEVLTLDRIKAHLYVSYYEKDAFPSSVYANLANGLDYCEICLLEDALLAFVPDYTSGNELAKQRLEKLKEKILKVRGWMHILGRC